MAGTTTEMERKKEEKKNVTSRIEGISIYIYIYMRVRLFFFCCVLACSSCKLFYCHYIYMYILLISGFLVFMSACLPICGCM